MDTGFSSLTALKVAVLPADLRARTTWDTVLTTVGLGVRRALEEYVNRVWERAEDAHYLTSAQRTYVVVDRYPLESVSEVEISAGPGTWEALGTEAIYSLSEEAGLVEFGSMLGTHRDRIRLTYTGGYWWDTSEDASGTLPAGAHALPADLLLAWQTQVQHELEARDLLTKAAARPVTDRPNLQELSLLPRVKETLRSYIRYA